MMLNVQCSVFLEGSRVQVKLLRNVSTADCELERTSQTWVRTTVQTMVMPFVHGAHWSMEILHPQDDRIIHYDSLYIITRHSQPSWGIVLLPSPPRGCRGRAHRLGPDRKGEEADCPRYRTKLRVLPSIRDQLIAFLIEQAFNEKPHDTGSVAATANVQACCGNLFSKSLSTTWRNLLTFME